MKPTITSAILKKFPVPSLKKVYKIGQKSFYADKKNVTFTASNSGKLRLIKGLIYYFIITAYCTYSLQIFNYIIIYTLLHVSAKVSQLQEDTHSFVSVYPEDG
jgi:hypothetical protein